ncbi:hypothetical protein CMO93_01535 [Candidatus Woesearchaeota archaeon]|nr:hypothetical protein [Candidatus Woesearchaeota archaeon]|tara:strand:+ start:2573 stop:3937 length:1365 start_codon:yes stop_codon:yes gene_type:complete
MANKKRNGKKSPAKSADSILKSLKFGVEFELFTLDEQGRMIYNADKIMKKVKESAKQIDAVKECGKNMLEINSFPHTDIPDVMQKTLDDFELVLHCAEKENTVLYSYGTYPGEFMPKMNRDRGCKIKENIFGKNRFMIAARCIGLHCHYSLPWGVFDPVKKVIKHLVNSKNKQSMVNAYNLFIAMDPALITFAQSSPFYQGKHLGKDSRVIAYRGGDILKYPPGLYTNYPDFGMLQPYKVTGTDLLQIIKHRFDSWSDVLKKVDMNLKVFMKHGSILDTTWNPVKISSHGTIEQRGMDMCHPRLVIALATLIQYISKEVQEKFVQVLPSDIGLTEPFKKEGNVIYIPPHTHVRFDLQLKSAYNGMEDKLVHNYCKGLLKLAKLYIPKSKYPLIAPLEKMITEKKTVSDHILADARKLGAKESISNKQAAELALKHSKDLFKEIIMTKQIIKGLT